MIYESSPLINVDMEDSLLFSIRRVLNTEIPNVPILYEREKATFTRPSFTLDIQKTKNTELTPKWWESERNVYIRYYGPTLDSCKSVASKLEYVILARKRLISHRLKDWMYPIPSLRELTGQSTPFSAGTYNIKVEAKNLLGEWSLACDSTPITISDESSIVVMIPSVGGGIGYFTQFKVYVGTVSGTEKLAATIDRNPNTIVTQTVITELPNSGNNSPITTSEIGYRFLRVGTLETTYIQDPLSLGIWDALLSLEVCFTNTRQNPQHVPIVSINHKVNIIV